MQLVASPDGSVRGDVSFGSSQKRNEEQKVQESR